MVGHRQLITTIDPGHSATFDTLRFVDTFVAMSLIKLPQVPMQKLDVETLARDIETSAHAAGMSRRDLDIYITMAEHEAISGLDDSWSSGSHYLDASVQRPEAGLPYPDMPDTTGGSSTAVRRIESLAYAHRTARKLALAELTELEARGSSSAEEVAAARAKLARLGDAPTWAAANSKDEFEAQQECAVISKSQVTF